MEHIAPPHAVSARRPFSDLHDVLLHFPRPTNVPHDSDGLDVDAGATRSNVGLSADMREKRCKPPRNVDECCHTCSVCLDDIDAASLATSVPFGAPLCGAPACAAAIPVLCCMCAKAHVRSAVSSTTRGQLPVVRCIGAVGTASGGCGGALLPPRLWVSIATGNNCTDNADCPTRANRINAGTPARGDDNAIWADVHARARDALTLQCGACHKRGSMLLQALPADGRALAPLSRLSVSARAAWQRNQAEDEDDLTLSSTNMGDALLLLARSCFGDTEVQAALAAARVASARSSRIAALAAAFACNAANAAVAAAETAMSELCTVGAATELWLGPVSASPEAHSMDIVSVEQQQTILQQRMVHRRRYRNMLHVGVAPAAVRHRITLDGHFSPPEADELMLSLAGAGWEDEHEGRFSVGANPAVVHRSGQVLLSLALRASRFAVATDKSCTDNDFGGNEAESETQIASLRAEVARCLILTGALDDLIQQHHATHIALTRKQVHGITAEHNGNDAETAAAPAVSPEPRHDHISTSAPEIWKHKAVAAVDLVKALLNLQNALTSSQGLARRAVILICRALTSHNVVLRASLQLALYRTVPCGGRVLSLCCGAVHCFNCKSQGYHNGKTCAQHQAERATDDIVPCPECGTSIVKGDGCGSIVCVCGHGFSWSIALAKLRATQASAWQHRFKRIVEAELVTDTPESEPAYVDGTGEEPLSPRTAYVKRRSRFDLRSSDTTQNTVVPVGLIRADFGHRLAHLLVNKHLGHRTSHHSLPRASRVEHRVSPPLSFGDVSRQSAAASAKATWYRKRLVEVSSLHAVALIAADKWFCSVQEQACKHDHLLTGVSHQRVQCAAAEEQKDGNSAPNQHVRTTHCGDRASLLRAAARDLYIPCLGLTLGRELAKTGPAATHMIDAEQPDAMLTQAKAWLHASSNASAVAAAQATLWETVCVGATAANDRTKSVSEAHRASGDVELAYSAKFLGTGGANHMEHVDGGGAVEAGDTAHGETQLESMVAQATRELFLRTDPSLVASAAAQHHREAFARGHCGAQRAQCCGEPKVLTPSGALCVPRHPHAAAHGTVASQLRSHPLLVSRMGRSGVAHGDGDRLQSARQISGSAKDIAILSWAKSWAAMHPTAMARVCIDALTTYDMLQSKPTGLRRDALESYLPDSEFRIVFGMCRDEFKALPEWKQRDKKRAVGLF